ncbi:MAG: hypothetical protein J2P37_36875, partial [Ktedonobacteraceae bacterium]|nr:hypothetical protein [Ktedonobacteraceae bacterium]
LKLRRVGVRENFFEIGGHSLTATQVVSRVKNVFGVEIGVRSIFEKPTVEGLARRIEDTIRAGERNETPPLVKVSREGLGGARLPLSFAQQRLWFIDQLMPNNHFYNIPGAVRLDGRLNLEVLERVINEIVRRHEVLRTRFEADSGGPVQVIDEWVPRKVKIEDLTSIPRKEREEEIGRIQKEEMESGFDLSRGPLFRVRVLKLEEEEHHLLYTVHHIVSDGWSMEILRREVDVLYQAFRRGEESPLEELPIQYADFTVWQRLWLQGEVLAQEIEYWREQLAGLQPLELPTDYPRPTVKSYRGAGYHFMVERELVEPLRELSRRQGVTLFMTLLGSFGVLMSRYSGQADIVLGTDIANRNRAEIEGVIGFFVNQLVLRVEVRPGDSFGELLKRVKDVCLGAYAHQDVPFEKLVEELQPERDLGRSPLFQAKLILENASGEKKESEGTGQLNAGYDEARAAKFDLTMAILDLGSSLVGGVEYSLDLYEGETIRRLVSHYRNVLEGDARG